MASISDRQVTVVGGGAVGAAALYFLARAGFTDIQLLEASDPGSATTGQAAGLVGQSRTTLDRTLLTMSSAQLYRDMEAQLGFTCDWRETGSIRIAMTEGAVRELELIRDVAAQADLHVELVDGHRVQDICPAIEDVSEVRLALWCPTDGYVQPTSLTNAYIAAAKALGATVVSNTRVERINVENGVVTGLETKLGPVVTETVVNATGPWAGALARTAGVDLPIVPVLHEYFITDPQDGWDNNIPALRIPEIQVYARGEGRGILCGGFETQGTSVDPTAVSVDSPLAATPNWEVLAAFAEGFARFVPSVADAGIQTVFKGWPGFSPDGRFIVGPVEGVRGLVLAAACNAHGVSGSAGLAQHLIESMSGDPSPYVESLSPNRFIPRDWEWDRARVEAQAICENYYPLPQEN